MARVFHAQNEDPDVGVLAQAPHLFLEQVGGAEEQLALDVDDRDLRIGPLGGVGHLAELAALVEGVLDERGSAGFLQEEYQGGADADVDGDFQLEKQRGAQGDGKHHGVGAGGAEGHPDLRPVDELVAHPHQVRRQGGDRDVVEDRREEKQDQQHHHAAEHGGKLRGRPALVVDGRPGERGRGGRDAKEPGGDVARAHAEQFLVGLEVLAALGRQRLGDGGGLQHADDGNGDHRAGHVRQQHELLLERRQPGQRGNRGRQRALVLDHEKRHRVQTEDVKAAHQLREHAGGHAKNRQPDERLGPGRPPALDPLEHRQGQQADADRPPGEIHGLHGLDHLVQHGEESLPRRHVESHQVGRLARDQQHADGRGVPDDHRARNKLRDLAEVEQAGQELHHADQERQVGGQRQRMQAEGGVGGDGGGGDQADRGGRAEDVVVRRKEQRAEKAAHHHRHDHRHRRQSQDEGEADGLRHRDKGQRRAGDQVGAQFRRGVVLKLRDEGETHPEHLGAHRRRIGERFPEHLRRAHARSVGRPNFSRMRWRSSLPA